MFSPDGKRMFLLSATTDRDGDKTFASATVVDAATGKEIIHSQLQEGYMHFPMFSPDGTRVVSVSDQDKSVWLLEAATLKDC